MWRLSFLRLFLWSSEGSGGDSSLVHVHWQHLLDFSEVDLHWLEIFSRIQGVSAGLHRYSIDNWNEQMHFTVTSSMFKVILPQSLMMIFSPVWLSHFVILARLIFRHHHPTSQCLHTQTCHPHYQPEQHEVRLTSVKRTQESILELSINHYQVIIWKQFLSKLSKIMRWCYSMGT